MKPVKGHCRRCGQTFSMGCLLSPIVLLTWGLIPLGWHVYLGSCRRRRREAARLHRGQCPKCGRGLIVSNLSTSPAGWSAWCPEREPCGWYAAGELARVLAERVLS